MFQQDRMIPGHEAGGDRHDVRAPPVTFYPSHPFPASVSVPASVASRHGKGRPQPRAGGLLWPDLPDRHRRQSLILVEVSAAVERGRKGSRRWWFPGYGAARLIATQKRSRRAAF